MKDTKTEEGVLTVEQFDARYTHIQEQLQAKQEKVDGYRDQSLAKLFSESGWTQQKIADHVGLERSFVSRLILYGNFLAFVSTGHNLTIPANLTERAFRKHWATTPNDKKDEQRFYLVVKSMVEGDVLPDECESLRTKIVKACEEFASKKQIIERVGCTPKQFEDNWNHINKDKRYVVQHNKGSVKHRKYKVRRAGRKVDLSVLTEKLEPLLEDLERQGNATSMAEYAPHLIKVAVERLRQLLEEC